MSRLRRLVLSDRFFFVTCRLFPNRRILSESELDCFAQTISARRKRHGFLVTAWVFLPDHWHAILYPHHPLTISDVMESIKVSSTRRINRGRGELGLLWQGRFFDRAVRTAKEYHETVEYIHWNPVKAGLVSRPEDWPWSSVHDYSVAQSLRVSNSAAFGAAGPMATKSALVIDRVVLPMDPRARI